MRRETADRIAALLAAARRVADAGDPLGQVARERWQRELPLSPEGIELALTRALELSPSDAELDALAGSVEAAPRVRVLLSSTVFTAALRAIAVGLAASARVFVRASRRDTVLPELLARAAPGLFELVPELVPDPGDHVHAYASAETLAALRRALPRGVTLHAHGPGFGAVAADGEPSSEVAHAIAEDVAVFDQRGCLSPRVLVVSGDAEVAERWAVALARALDAVERAVPRGQAYPEEAAESARYRDALAYAGSIRRAGLGFVGVAPEGAPFRIAPVGRHLHVIPTQDAAALLRAQAPAITTFSVAGSVALSAALRQELPTAREAQPGRMQSPAFDGPVDRRVDRRGELL